MDDAEITRTDFFNIETIFPIFVRLLTVWFPHNPCSCVFGHISFDGEGTYRNIYCIKHESLEELQRFQHEDFHDDENDCTDYYRLDWGPQTIGISDYFDVRD